MRRITTRVRSLVSTAAAAAAVVIAGCGNHDTAADARLRPIATELRRSGTTSAQSDDLAAEWLNVAAALPIHGARPPLPRTPPHDLAERLRRHALDHARIAILTGTHGPSLAGTARIRRLAVAADAPHDRNRNGTNLDETLTHELDLLSGIADAPDIRGIASVLAPHRAANAILAGAPDAIDLRDLATLRTARAPTPAIDASAFGPALRLRVFVGAALGGSRRAGAVGASDADGLLALVAIQQALAIDEAVLRDLLFDGASFVPLNDPRDYDPALGARWIPSRLRYVPHPSLPDTPADWTAEDHSAELADLAQLLRAGVELAWLTDPRAAPPSLAELFVAGPLAPPAGSGPPPPVTTWVDDVRPILHGQAGCLGCHSPPTVNGNYSVASYESALLAGASGVRAVNPGDHTTSPLWLVLNGPWTPPNRPFPVPRMPFGRPPLPRAQIDLIAKWIDEGAHREQPPRRDGLRPGLDLARVLFRNARTLHEVAAGPHAGLLDRRVGVTRSGLVDARSTGLALDALAALVAHDAVEPGTRDALRRWTDAAIAHLCTTDGAVVAELDLTNGTRSTLPADLAARAALAAGLLAAGRVLGDDTATQRGRAASRRLLDDSFDAASGLFATFPGDPARRLPAQDVAIVFGWLGAMQLAGDLDAADALDVTAARLATVFPFSELGGGERLGDGVADTDGNGVVEPAANGLAPMLADLVLEGPPSTAADAAPITWSRHVLPLFRARCAGCHVDGAAEGNYRVDTVALAATPGQSATPTMIVPGDPQASFLAQKLRLRVPSVGAQMPLARPPLAPFELAIVEQWIASGARDR